MILEILASSVLSSTRQRVIDNDNDDDAIFKVLQELCDLSLYVFVLSNRNVQVNIRQGIHAEDHRLVRKRNAFALFQNGLFPFYF